MKTPLTKEQIEMSRKVAKEAYKIYIGSNDKLTPEKYALANAFCMGARYQRQQE